jgi:SAM-dependent methyltransferase
MDDSPDRLVTTQAVWEAQAQADPLWAVLSEPDKRGRGWNVVDFMATGEEHVAKALAKLAEFGGELPDHSMAVDFGSGVGRLTQALADRFDHVTGIDISPTMVAVARRLNRHGERVQYRLNERGDLSLLPDGFATLTLTHITLQHVPPDAARTYIREFLRVTKPGGGVIFQLPSHYTDDYLPGDRDDAPIAAADRRADVVIVAMPGTVAAGQAFTVDVRVRNASLVGWQQSAVYPIRVGNHWMDVKSGAVIINDDGRTRLPGRVAAGAWVDATIVVTAPDMPDRYRLGVDVVQEAVGWFGDLGAQITVADIDVVAPRPTPAVTASPAAVPATSYSGSTFDDLISPSFAEAPMFEMNAITRSEVEQIIADHGATVLGVEEWVTEWHSFTYYVRVGG